MSKPVFDRGVVTDVNWWHWTLTIPLLAAHLAGYHWALMGVGVLSALAAGYYWHRLRQLRPYPVQVRIAYLAWTVAGSLPGMSWMHWVQLFGTTAMVTVGYCPLLRLLSLLPPNRQEPFTASLVWRAFVQSPCSGGLLAWPAGPLAPNLSCCALPAKGSPVSCSLARHHAKLTESPTVPMAAVQNRKRDEQLVC